ncbi:MAG: hypothetical protein H5T84_01405, partial [Thermoleophilia bacterium]|nr:hypothetical protein [Thermoleophilia bacterium]
MRNRLLKIAAGVAAMLVLGLGATGLALAKGSVSVSPAAASPAAVVQQEAPQPSVPQGPAVGSAIPTSTVLEREDAKGTVDNDNIQEENGAGDATEVGQAGAGDTEVGHEVGQQEVNDV